MELLGKKGEGVVNKTSLNRPLTGLGLGWGGKLSFSEKNQYTVAKI